MNWGTWLFCTLALYLFLWDILADLSYKRLGAVFIGYVDALREEDKYPTSRGRVRLVVCNDPAIYGVFEDTYVVEIDERFLHLGSEWMKKFVLSRFLESMDLSFGQVIEANVDDYLVALLRKATKKSRDEMAIQTMSGPVSTLEELRQIEEGIKHGRT